MTCGIAPMKSQTCIGLWNKSIDKQRKNKYNIIALRIANNNFAETSWCIHPNNHSILGWLYFLHFKFILTIE